MNRMMLMALLFVPAISLADPPRPPAPPDRPERMERVMEREAEILELVGKHAPERLETLKQLKQDDPQSYRRTMMRIAKVMRDADGDEAQVGRVIEMKSLEMDIRDQAEGWEALSAKDQKTRRAELEQMAHELFELKQEHRRTRLADMEARLQELRAEIEEREANEDELIDRFLERMIHGRADL